MELFILIVLQALVFGYFARYIASEKNRDTTSWFILGFFFSLLAILALIAIPKLESQNSDKALSKTNSFDGYKKCPDCAEHIRIEARICRFCKHKFTDEEIAEELEKESGSSNEEYEEEKIDIEEKFVCSNCGGETAINEKYCSWCGGRIGNIKTV